MQCVEAARADILDRLVISALKLRDCVDGALGEVQGENALGCPSGATYWR